VRVTNIAQNCRSVRLFGGTAVARAQAARRGAAGELVAELPRGGLTGFAARPLRSPSGVDGVGDKGVAEETDSSLAELGLEAPRDAASALSLFLEQLR